MLPAPALDATIRFARRGAPRPGGATRYGRLVVSTELLAERFRSFARTTTRAPLYRSLAERIADDPQVLGLLGPAPDQQAVPVLLLAAVHSLVLAEPQCELARHYRNLHDPPSHGDPWPVFRRFALERSEEIMSTVAHRHTQTNEVGRCALFVPGLALVSAEVGAMALVDVGTSAGLNLLLGHYRYRYSGDNGITDIGPDSPVELSCSLRGRPHLPDRPPEITSAVGLDAQPIDVSDDDECRWLEACVWPDQVERFHRLVSAVTLARDAPPDVRRGDAVRDAAPLALAAAATAHPVVLTSWVLNYLSPEERVRFVAALDAAGRQVDLTWLIAESPAATGGIPLPTTTPAEELTVLALVRWRGGIRTTQRLATCHPHGSWMHWEIRASHGT